MKIERLAIDSSLLLLLVVGGASRRHVGAHKRRGLQSLNFNHLREARGWL